MKKRVLVIVISVVVILVGVFGVNILLAHQNNKQTATVSAEAKVGLPVAQSSIPPIEQAKTEDPITSPQQYNAGSSRIVMNSFQYMPSNLLQPQDNLSLSDTSQQLISAWVDQQATDKTHQGDSLINGEIDFRAFVGKFSYYYYTYPIIDPNKVADTLSGENTLSFDFLLPIKTVYGKSALVYKDTIHDLGIFANYLLRNYTPEGNYGIIVSINGHDGKAISYYSFRAKISPSADFYYRNDFVYTNQGGGTPTAEALSSYTNNKVVYWSTPLANSKTYGVKTRVPWDCPQAQEGLEQVGEKFAQGLKLLN